MGLFDALKKASASKPAAAPAAVLPPPEGRISPVVEPAPAHVGVPQNPGGEKFLLFAGGDAAWFSQIERDIRCLQPNWRCTYSADSKQMLEKWASGSFFALVVDGKMTDGPGLVKALEKEIAQTICLVRCNTHDRAAAAHWKGTGVAFVSEEGDASVLAASVKRAARLRDWMADAAIKKLVAQIRKLPAQPKLHTEVSTELQSPSGSLDTVGRLISQDPVMSAKILQVVNSAFFGMSREISDTTESVMVLGAERIKALILLAAAFSQYSNAKCPGFSIEPIWGHSLQVGLFARAIALAETKNTRTAEAAFTAGLLHDIGKLVLAGNLPEMYGTVMRLRTSRNVTTREAEMEMLGTSHAELGACLLATWGLPLPILEAIAWHHQPERSDEHGFSLLAAVHAANAFSQEQTPGDFERAKINTAYLINAGLGDCAGRWREICGVSDAQKSEAAEELARQRREAKEN